MKQYLITKRSPISGQEHTFYIWFNQEQWREVQPFLDPALPKGRSIQEILPDHSPFEHAFLLTGTTHKERSRFNFEAVKGA